MKTLPNLSSQQANSLISFFKSLTPRRTIQLNPAESAPRKFIETMLEAAGRSRADYPHLYKMLDKSGGIRNNPDMDSIHLVDAGKTADGKTTVTIWSSSTGDTIIKSGVVLVFDADTGALLAHGENSAVRNGFLACPTRSKTAAPAGKKLSILYLGHTTDADGSTRFYSYAENTVVADQGIKVNVIDPVIKHQGNTEIHIAVGRTTGHSIPSNTDYVYYEPTGEGTNPYLIAPFNGNVGLSGSIDLANLSISALTTSIFVNNGNGGTAEVTRATQYTTDAKMLAAFSVGSAPNILQWTFPYDQKGYATTNSIVYNTTTLGNEIDSFFYFAFNGIPLQGGDTAPPFYVCSVDTPEEPSINCTKIPNMYYWWHCLAKGTLVTLEDGTLKPIEEINETFRVRTGTDGKGFAVWATVLGRHRSSLAEDTHEKIFRLTTANGKSITATENHVVFTTANECRRISDIVAGDRIVTQDGMSTVASNESIQYDDMFYALALGNPEEQAKPDFPHNMANYYAGGILCGDQQAMRHNTVAAHNDLDYMLPRIKPELQRDFTSALNHKRF